MLKTVGVVLLTAIAIILAIAATKPDTFTVTRKIEIAAAPETIHPLVADFRNWTAWSPWEGLDPAMRRNYSGAASGVGSVYAWEGNDEVGAGRMEIVSMSAPRDIGIQLAFIRPFESVNQTRFTFEPRDGTTQVTWNMSGPMPFISKIMSVFFSMDSMIGPDFEKGLAKIKALAESRAR